MITNPKQWEFFLEKLWIKRVYLRLGEGGHSVDFNRLDKDYNEEKKQILQHQEIYKVDTQDYIKEEDLQYPAKIWISRKTPMHLLWEEIQKKTVIYKTSNICLVLRKNIAICA